MTAYTKASTTELTSKRPSVPTVKNTSTPNRTSFGSKRSSKKPLKAVITAEATAHTTKTTEDTWAFWPCSARIEIWWKIRAVMTKGPALSGKTSCQKRHDRQTRAA